MTEMQSDASIEQALASVPADLWEQLFEVAHSFLAEPEHTAWDGGQQVGTTTVNDEKRAVFQMPYASYSDSVERIVALLYEIGVVHPFDWSNWEGTDRYRGRNALRTAPVADAARMATVIVRSDRFCEGTIAAAIEDGTFAAVLERLLRWYDSER
jgi:hypothetical protein